MYTYNATVLNVVDGDTADMLVDLGMDVSIKGRFRFLYVDTPEKFGEEKRYGMIMKQYAKSLLEEKHVVIKSAKDDNDIATDSFGRYLVEITLDDGRKVHEIYNELGVNKYQTNYSVENVLKLQ